MWDAMGDQHKTILGYHFMDFNWVAILFQEIRLYINKNKIKKISGHYINYLQYNFIKKSEIMK